MSHDDPTRTLIDDYLAAQQRLQTPVKRFSDRHDAAEIGTEPVWRDLIPLSTPKNGEQYAFEVDLDRCTGCKACVAGCHSLNGLDDEETWRDVGLILGGTRSHPFQQTVTTACHHCADPACLNGCPVLAYEKDPVTGIVRHLDDQCIGCQYCVLKCPYDVPKYSERLGIVRKCDMCHNRLGAGEAPACVQACPTQAIRIVTVQTHVTGTNGPDTSEFLPTAPDPSYTKPTTRYVTNRTLPSDVAAADVAVLRPQSPHWPLVSMLTFMPMAVGCFALAAASNLSPFLSVAGWLAAAVGLATSVLHLGQPLRAWRVFLGLRRSWLSREAVLFGLWFPLASSYALARWNPGGVADFLTSRAHALGVATTAIGAVALLCSVMIYVDTRRSFWRFSQTAPRFFGTAIVLAGATAYTLQPDWRWAGLTAAALLLKLAVETRCLRALDLDEDTYTPDQQTARILAGPLRPVLALRYALAVGVIAGPACALALGVPALSWLTLPAALAGELAERYLYFRAVCAPKMPGVVST